MSDRDAILARLDAGQTPVQIAAALAVSLPKVYGILRAERPNRSRSARTRTSTLPAQMLALHAAGLGVARIAELLQTSRTYVYRTIQLQRERDANAIENAQSKA